MLIGPTGAAGAGKDTAGMILESMQWRATAFATALRIEVAAGWGLDLQILTRRELKERPMPALAAGLCSDAGWLRYLAAHGHDPHAMRSPRWLMQQWGSHRRQQDADYWIRHVQRWLQYQRGHHHHDLVITDVRMPNEAAMLRAAGGAIVRVHRPHLAGLPADTAQHESEGHTALAADADLHNDGSLQDLAADLLRVLKRLQHATA